MKLTAIILLSVALTASAAGLGQTVSLTMKKAPLPTVFTAIEKQTGYTFIYAEPQLQGTHPVDVDVRNASLTTVLDMVFRDQPVLYQIQKTYIVLKNKPAADKINIDEHPPVTVRGRIVNENGEPVVATITVKGTNNSTTSNSNGEYVLNNVDEKATLVFTAVNIEPTERKVNSSVVLNVTVTMKVKEGDETIVVAYNKIKARSNVGAVTIIKGEEIQTLPNRSFDKSLQGLVPGLLVTQGTGQPGGGTSNFVLRGIATGADPNLLNTARNPLIVMDGIPLFQEPASVASSNVPVNNPLAQLNASDIETITVLKDAAAIALYGSKASNGVILVTTKKGNEGRTNIGFRHQTEFAERLKSNEEMLNQSEYLELLYETYKNTNPALYTDAVILADLKTKFPTRSDGSFYPQADWVKELYRKGATTITNEISVSGGNAKQTYYLNLEYTKQDGVLRGTGFDRKAIRFNYENKPASWLKLGLNTFGSYTVQDIGVILSEQAAMRISPLNPVRNELGELIYNYQWGGASATNPTTITTYFANPVAARDLNMERNNAYRGLMKLYGEMKFLKYFSLASNLGADFMLSEAKYRIHPKLGAAANYPNGNITGINNRTANLVSTNTLRFDRVFSKKHSVTLIAGHEAQLRTDGNMRINMADISSNPMTEQLTIGTVSGDGVTTKEALLSYFGQANYGYKERYYFTASIRTDGSSLFGENNLFGSHWSAGGGWVVSSEPFMKGTAGWLDYLKLRGSIGSAGNSAGINNTLRYHRLTLLSYMGSTAILPEPNFPPNPGIKWEKTFLVNAGMEARLFKDRASIGIEWYNRKTEDLLGTIATALSTGYMNMRTNIGDMRNSGIEISASVDVVRTKNFRWKVSANWSRNKNRLIKSSYPLETAAGSASVSAGSINVNGPGENYNSFYLVTWAGVDPATGKPLWIDSTGKPSSNWSAAKPSFVGKPQPDAFGSFSQNISWKSFSLSMTLIYQYGFQIYINPLGTASYTDGVDPYVNQGRVALDRWQKPGDIAANPRRLLFGSIAGVSDNATAQSTRYLLDGDYIRLNNVSISYRLPKEWISRLHLSSCSVFLQGSNLATWTKYSGRQDPENTSSLGRAGTAYPLQRIFSIGCNINF